MRKCLCLVVSAGILLGLSAFAVRGAEPQAVIDKAIKAFGGEEKLGKKAGQAKSKGMIEIAGPVKFTQEVSFQLPDKFKETLDMDIMGQKVNVITVYNGKDAWVNANGTAVALNDKQIAEMKEAANMMRIGRLIFLKEKQHELSPLGEANVEGKPADGVKVATKGFRDINLYFDKQSGLLVKVERQAFDFMNNQEVTEERIITEYQEVDGTKVPKKVLVNRNGKKFMDVEVQEYKTLDGLDDSEFAKP